MILRFVFCTLLTLVTALPAALPLRDGESFTYKVSWAVLPGAGEIKVFAAADNTAAQPRLLVTTTTQTRGFARALLPFDASAESAFDLATARLISLTEANQQRGKKSAHTVTFDYLTPQALYTRTVPSAEPARPLVMPAGEPLDLITQLVRTRDWTLQPGEKRDALVLFDDDFYELTIYATRFEDVRTSLGTFTTLVLEPRMEKTAPKGMFKKGSTVRVWISQDERRLPVRFEVEFKIGTGVATLTRYEGPGPRAAMAPHSPDAKNSRP